MGGSRGGTVHAVGIYLYHGIGFTGANVAIVEAALSAFNYGRNYFIIQLI